jgi:hypothetical protein
MTQIVTVSITVPGLVAEVGIWSGECLHLNREDSGKIAHDRRSRWCQKLDAATVQDVDGHRVARHIHVDDLREDETAFYLNERSQWRRGRCKAFGMRTLQRSRGMIRSVRQHFFFEL